MKKHGKRYYLFLGFHILLAILICCAYLNKIISPITFSYFGLLALAFPILIIIHFIFTFIWLLKRDIIFLPMMIFSLFLFFPMKKFIHFGGKTAVKKENVLKILTYNTRYANQGVSLRSLDNYITKQNPDIAFFQEIYTRQWRTNDVFLTERYNAVYDLVGISSAYPIAYKQKLLLPGNAYACMADVVKGEDTIRCISAYLEPIYLNKKLFQLENPSDAKSKTILVTRKLARGHKMHQKQIDILTKYIKDSPYPIIVCGDFNSVPLSYEYFSMKGNLQDVFELSGEGLGLSFYDYFYPIRIDYILADKNFTPLSTHVDQSVKFSDHYPVISTLEFNPPNKL